MADHIALFNSPEEGAAAQFDLLATLKNYLGKRLEDAIRTWSGDTGGESNVQSYVKSLGLDPNTVISREFLQGPQRIGLAKAMAHFEAGKDFPLSDEEWKKAQDWAFGKLAYQAPTHDGGKLAQAALANAVISILVKILARITESWRALTPSPKSSMIRWVMTFPRRYPQSSCITILPIPRAVKMPLGLSRAQTFGLQKEIRAALTDLANGKDAVDPVKRRRHRKAPGRS